MNNFVPRLLAFAITVTSVWSTASAQELPRLDPESMCRNRWTKQGAIDNEMYAYCLRNEQQAYDNLKVTWFSLSPSIRAVCSRRWGTPPGGAYEMLEYCAKEQSAAERSNTGTSFRW